MSEAQVHHGGQAARKGTAHIGWFIRSGVRFYRKHGFVVAGTRTAVQIEIPL